MGGGPGRYSLWLAKVRYEVHLIDPVHKHLEPAREASLFQPRYALKSVSEGDARTLDHPDDSVDLLLLMGPSIICPSGSIDWRHCARHVRY